MRVGVPKEIKPGERRVALTPDAVATDSRRACRTRGIAQEAVQALPMRSTPAPGPPLSKKRRTRSMRNLWSGQELQTTDGAMCAQICTHGLPAVALPSQHLARVRARA